MSNSIDVIRCDQKKTTENLTREMRELAILSEKRTVGVHEIRAELAQLRSR